MHDKIVTPPGDGGPAQEGEAAPPPGKRPWDRPRLIPVGRIVAGSPRPEPGDGEVAGGHATPT